MDTNCHSNWNHCPFLGVASICVWVCGTWSFHIPHHSKSFPGCSSLMALDVCNFWFVLDGLSICIIILIGFSSQSDPGFQMHLDHLDIHILQYSPIKYIWGFSVSLSPVSLLVRFSAFLGAVNMGGGGQVLYQWVYLCLSQWGPLSYLLGYHYYH